MKEWRLARETASRLQPHHGGDHYRLPDYPELPQQFIWQELDISPRFPVLSRFLEYGQRNLDGKLHSVRIAPRTLIRPPRFELVGEVFSIH